MIKQNQNIPIYHRNPKIVCKKCGGIGHTISQCNMKLNVEPYLNLLDIFEDDELDIFPEYN